MQVSLNFTIPDPAQLAVYVVIAIVAAAIVGLLARMRSPLGLLTTVILAGIGAWLFANVLRIQVTNDVQVASVPLIEALLGAVLFAALGGLLFRRRGDVVVYED